MDVEIPAPLIRRLRYSGGYRAGWLGKNGTLHSVESHCQFKPRGWKAANERHRKERRAKRREAGLPLRGKDRWGYPVWTPRNIDTYRWLSEQGYVRLEVQPGKAITVEAYPNWGGGFETVLTLPAAKALCALVHAAKPKILLLRNGWGVNPHSIPSAQIHGPQDILKEVHR